MADRDRACRLVVLWLALIFGLPAFADDEAGRQVQLTANTLEYGRFDIADKRGKLVLIAVWATWCPICLGELPELDRIYRKYHDAGFEMLR